jgi:hypothetical protein
MILAKFTFSNRQMTSKKCDYDVLTKFVQRAFQLYLTSQNLEHLQNTNIKQQNNNLMGVIDSKK